jgi:photoactive yellow protein
MNQKGTISFEQPDVLARLEALDDAGFDGLDFGAIGFDGDTRICRYNAYESQAASLGADKALGCSLFTDVAQCMNNYMVAQRFEDARSEGVSLDATIDYVLTWRMRPTKVKLRMLYSSQYPTRYILLHRLT